MFLTQIFRFEYGSFKNIKFPRGNYQTDIPRQTLYCLNCSPLNFLQGNSENPLSFLEAFIVLIHCDSFFTVKKGKQVGFLLSTEPCFFFNRK